MADGSSSVLHVEPTPDGRWMLRVDDDRPLSWHGSATDAERFARKAAIALHVDTVLLHDRYRRVATLWSDPSPTAH